MAANSPQQAEGNPQHTVNRSAKDFLVVSALDMADTTSLNAAAAQGDEKMVRTLLKEKADIESKSEVHRRVGRCVCLEEGGEVLCRVSGG